MPYTAPKTWVAGDVLTAAQLNQHLRDQLLSLFPLGGDVWTSYTPTLTQGATVSKTILYAKYYRVGRMIVAQVNMNPSSAGTAATGVQIGLPVTAASAANAIVGFGQIYDGSANAAYKGLAYLNSTTTFMLATTHSIVPNPLGAESFTAALTTGDGVTATVTYEAAT